MNYSTQFYTSTDDRMELYSRPRNPIDPNLLITMNTALSPTTRLVNYYNRLTFNSLGHAYHQPKIVLMPPAPPIPNNFITLEPIKFTPTPDLFDLILYKDREDSFYLKFLACIPVIGIIPAELAIRSLNAKRDSPFGSSIGK